MSSVEIVADSATAVEIVETSGQETKQLDRAESKGKRGKKGKGQSRGKDKGKRNSVEGAEHVDGWCEEGHNHRQQDTEHVEWKSSDSDGWW